MLNPVKRPKSPFYVARGTINGIRVEKSTGETTLTAARKACERIAAEILSSDAYSVPKGKLTVSMAINTYVANGGDGRFTDRIAAHFGKTLVSEIDAKAVRDAAGEIYPKAASSKPACRSTPTLARSTRFESASTASGRL